LNTSRKALLAMVATGTLFPRSAFAQSSAASVRVATQPAEFTADLIYAQQQGFFKKAGLDVDIQNLTNGNATSAAIISGAVDIGLNDTLGVAQAHTHGVDLVFIAPAAAYSPPWSTAFISLPETNLREPKDFNGKTIGTRGLRNAPNMMASAWIDKNGGDSSTIKWVEIVSSSAIAAIQAKRLDSVLIGEPYIEQGRGTGLHVNVIEHNLPADTWLVNGWTCRRDWVDANLDKAKRFAGAILEANRWANAHSEASFPIVAAYTGIPEATVAKMMRHPWVESGGASIAQPVIDISAHYGVLPHAFPAADIFYKLN
jgi:NitT/TauT family transport system substrate-binding protein